MFLLIHKVQKRYCGSRSTAWNEKGNWGSPICSLRNCTGTEKEREVGCGLQKSEAISPRIHLSRDLNEGSEQCGYLGEYSR